MATTTANLGLTLPVGGENFSLSMFNGNMTLIDTFAGNAQLASDSGTGYCKMDDGTMIQWGQTLVNEDRSMAQIASSGIYYSYTNLTLPKAFIDTNYRVTGASRYGTGHCIPAGFMPSTASIMIVHMYDFYARPLNDAKLYVQWVAVGRWK